LSNTLGRPPAKSRVSFSVTSKPVSLADPAHDLERIIGTHQRTVWRYLRALGCDAARADDLTQETFLQGIRAGLEDRGVRATGAFLCSIARYVFLRSHRSLARRRARETAFAADALWREQAAAGDGDLLLEQLRECLGQLGDRAARAVDLQYGQGYSRRRIAAALGLAPNGVKTLMQRTRQALRACLEKKAHD